MANQTYSFLLQAYPNIDFLFFVFFSTICSYSFHWFLASQTITPLSRIGWAAANRRLYIILFFTGLLGAAIFFFYLLSWWPWLFFSAFVTFLYSAPQIPNKYFRALRNVALGKTIFLAFVWMYVTTVLPIIISEKSWQPDFTLFVLGRFFFIYAICILFDYRDRDTDKATGIRSLITYLSERSVTSLYFFSLVIFAITTMLLIKYHHRLIDVVIILIPGMIAAILYNYARKTFSDFLYYFVLDGLMALSALLMLIPGI